jgi:Na+-transporting methylmalonyl-CoA/oxaloacetate decarboxylase gamma subunit
MKIIVLLMLIGAIVGISQLPIRRQAKAPASAPTDSISASA